MVCMCLATLECWLNGNNYNGGKTHMRWILIVLGKKALT
jgi:hypothetical protein